MKYLSLLFIVTLFASTVKAEDSTDVDVSVMSMSFETKHPFVRPLGGITSMELEGAADIESSITLGAVLGFENTRRITGSNILRNQSNGLYVIHHAEQSTSSETFSLTAWRFGFSNGESYGYAFSDVGSAGFYMGADKTPLAWTSVTISNAAPGLEGEVVMQRFPGSLRFGESATASLGLRVAEPITITAGFEWAQTYERHLFWKWAGSAVIEGVADGLAGWFVRAIGKNSPAALPIMHFILRNGVAMGFKALRNSEMNWPFTSAPPLNFMTYSVGVNIVF